MEASERVELGGEGEDDVVMADGQDALGPCLDPRRLGQGLAVGAMAIAARVVHRHLVMALGAGVEMPSRRCGAATKDVTKEPSLLRRQEAACIIVETVAAEDVHHFRALRWCRRPLSRSGGPGAGGWHGLARQLVGLGQLQKVGQLGDVVDTDLGVAGGAPEALVPEQCLDHPDIDPGLQC